MLLRELVFDVVWSRNGVVVKVLRVRVLLVSTAPTGPSVVGRACDDCDGHLVVRSTVRLSERGVQVESWGWSAVVAEARGADVALLPLVCCLVDVIVGVWVAVLTVEDVRVVVRA